MRRLLERFLPEKRLEESLRRLPRREAMEVLQMQQEFQLKPSTVSVRV